VYHGFKKLINLEDWFWPHLQLSQKYCLLLSNSKFLNVSSLNVPSPFAAKEESKNRYWMKFRPNLWLTSNIQIFLPRVNFTIILQADFALVDLRLSCCKLVMTLTFAILCNNWALFSLKRWRLLGHPLYRHVLLRHSLTN